jgi:hypothetical protein
MISLFADTFTLTSILQTIAFVAGAMPTLKITAMVLVLLWLVLFLVGEVADAVQDRDRRTSSKDHDL